MEPDHSDVLIVGAGIFGTSTAFHLAKSRPELSVTVIDRSPFPPHHAASTDINKIIRQDYTSSFYMHLATGAMHAWETWPELAGKGYYHKTGWINFSEKGSTNAKKIRKNFRSRGVDPTSTVTLSEVRERFGGLFKETDFEGFEEEAYWNPDAAWCDAGLATAELMQTAVDRGVRYVTADVTQLVRGDQGLSCVETSDGRRLSGDKFVLASGAWTSSLMSPLEDVLDIPEEDRTEQQVTAACVCVAHYKLGKEELEQLSEMPVIIYGDHGDAQPPPRGNLLKFTNGHSLTNTITTETGQRLSMPPHKDQHEVPLRLQEETLRLMPHRIMPLLTRNRPVEYWRLCWDAVSPSQDHVICRHPHPKLCNLYVAVGGSFHSYKFLPTIGKDVVKVLEGRDTGGEKKMHWAWKKARSSEKGAHEKALPRRELRDME